MKFKQDCDKTILASGLVKLAKELLAAKPSENMDKTLQKLGKFLRAEDTDKAIDALSDAGSKLNGIKSAINSVTNHAKGINKSHLKQVIAALKPVVDGKVEGDKAERRLKLALERAEAAESEVDTVVRMLDKI